MTNYEIIQVFLGSGLLGGVLLTIFRVGRVAKSIEVMASDIAEMKKDITKIKEDVHGIDRDLSKLEGSFEERGRWEVGRSILND